MANDLTFTKHVADVRGAVTVPTIERKVAVQPTSTPEFQKAFHDLAESQNSLSAIGAHVAQAASNQMASQLGYESGKNPHGELMPAITEFDRHFADSYHQQANAVLSVQGQKLLDDAQIKISKLNRLTPQDIENANAQVQFGLSKIAEQAPTAVRGQLEANFASHLLNQNKNLTDKMIGQQREDQKYNLINAIHVANANAVELGINGDFKGSERAAKSASDMAKSALNNRFISPDDARVFQETATQSSLNGLYSHLATQAYKNGTYSEFEKEYAEHPPEGITNKQYVAAGQAFKYQIEFLKGLHAEQQSIAAIKFEEEIVQGANLIPPTRMLALKNQVSELQYEKLQLELIKAKKKFDNEKAGSDQAIAGFGNAEIYGGLKPSEKNTAFHSLTGKYLQKMQSEGNPISLDEAEAHVAIQAAGAVPGYVNVLNTKFASTKPEDIESAGRSTDQIFSANKGANLQGLDPQSLAMYNLYKSLRRALPPQEAAQQSYQSIYNQTPDEKKVVEDNWSDEINKIKSDKLKYFTELGGFEYTKYDFLGFGGQERTNLIDPLGFVEQAEEIMHNNFVHTKGDLNTAKKMTADTLRNTYGESHVNGQREVTFYPLENAVGIPSDGARFIQDDIIEHVNKELESTKKAFNAGASPFYWEVEPKRSLEGTMNQRRGLAKETTIPLVEHTNLEKYEKDTSMVIHKHWKNGTRETFPLIVKADPWLSKSANPTKPYTAGWDIVIGTETGYSPLSRENPLMGNYIVYKPNVQKIKAKYLTYHGLKG